jgi:hypothetical protein
MLTIVMMTEDQVAALPTGEWTLNLENKSDDSLAVHGFLNDALSGWSRGPIWLDGLSADTTLCAPSTATEALSVAAYAGVHDGVEGQGNLRDYSSRGPRMDGAIKIGLAAPDDPYTTLPSMTMPYSDKLLHGAYTVFGGTSGAGPHVAGALALLMQAADGLSAEAAVQAMYDGALTTPKMGVLPNKDWGFGKLDVHRAALGTAAMDNSQPVAKGTATDLGNLQILLDGETSSDPDGDPLTYRWDTNYDGSWNTEQSDNPQAVLEGEEAAAGIARLRVYDDKGTFSEVLVPWQMSDEPLVVEPAPQNDVFAPGGDVIGRADTAIGDDASIPGNAGVGSGGEGSKNGCAVGATPAEGWWFLLLILLALMGSSVLKEVKERG